MRLFYSPIGSHRTQQAAVMIPARCSSPGFSTTNDPILFLAICNIKITFLTASMTASSVRHHSQEPVFSSPLVISTSATVTFSKPFSCSGEEEVVPPKLLKLFVMINNSTGFQGHVKADCHEPDALEISHGQHFLLKTLCMQIGTQSHKNRMPVVHHIRNAEPRPQKRKIKEESRASKTRKAEVNTTLANKLKNEYDQVIHSKPDNYTKFITFMTNNSFTSWFSVEAAQAECKRLEGRKRIAGQCLLLVSQIWGLNALCTAFSLDLWCGGH
ncbi:hypothetical protein CFP56_023083 [Quercus suber]|uniref:Uncharacterized protein n=1 Tax=Quercus suber TaxID=58331 RepID=A0AAW0K8Y6_QUESU